MSPMDCATASYPRRFPTALLPKCAPEFHSYAIKFRLLEAGGDSLQELPASDFLLLAPAALEPDASAMALQLHLPLRACAEARLEFRGSLNLSAAELQCTKQFNLWLFNVILGRQPWPDGLENCEEGVKGYYVLPLSSEGGHPGIDWTVVKCALSSSVDCRRKSQYCTALHSAWTIGDAKGEASVPPEGHLRLWNGDFLQEDLSDAIVTSSLNGSLLCVVAVNQFDAWTAFPLKQSPGSITYADYYCQKYALELKHKQQPLLSARKLVCAASYLRSQASCADHPEFVFGGKFSKQMEVVDVPPELCILQVGLQARLWRGAVRLPSVLYSLEKALVAAELRDLIGLPMPTFKVLQALTSQSCQGDKSYEALELLGDSVLKIAGAAHLYVQDLAMNYEGLGDALYELVRNKTLYQYALGRSLPEYVFAEIFTPRAWIPPGPLHVVVRSSDSLKATRRLSFKTLADIVEALVGAYLLSGGFQASLQVTDVSNLQSKLGYCFTNLDYLGAALHYVPSDPVSVTMFQRLEFLGDAVLDYLITRHFVVAYPDLDPGKLNDLKQATVNSENYACVVVRNGFHVHLQEVSPALRDEIAGYVIDFCQEDGASNWSSFGLSSQTSPKVVGDVLQTIAASVFLDSGFNSEKVWEVFKPFLEPLATPDTVTLQPVRQLEKVCIEKKLRLDMPSFCIRGIVIVQAMINNVPFGISWHQEKRVARRLAAAKALVQLGTGIKVSGLDLRTHDSSGDLLRDRVPSIA